MEKFQVIVYLASGEVVSTEVEAMSRDELVDTIAQHLRGQPHWQEIGHLLLYTQVVNGLKINPAPEQAQRYEIGEAA